MYNKLGHYIFRRLCKDQSLLRKSNPMNTYGLYVTAKHIQTYVNDYHEYGIDYMGQDNDCAEDKQELKHFADGFHDGDWQIDMYWDEPEGNEQ